jgi:hypothetical protein
MSRNDPQLARRISVKAVNEDASVTDSTRAARPQLRYFVALTGPGGNTAVFGLIGHVPVMHR